jgi:hypothetical protein
VGLAGLVISLILVFRVMAFHSLDKSPTLWDRLFIWKSAVAIWSQEPLEGVGPGAFGGLFQLVKSPRTSGVSRYLMDAPAAHNEFLELLTDFGIVGFVWGFFLIKSLWPSKNIGRTSALTALGTASFFDFCLHTPFVALQGIGLLTSTEEKATAASWPAGFLAGGIALGLFVPAVFVPMLQRQSDGLKADGKWQAAYCCLENAERLNAWDARIVAAKADFLEEAYRQTRDGNRKKGSDEAFDQALDLEKVEGRFVFEKAQRLTRRLEIANAPGDIQKAREAWIQARAALPLNAFVFFQEGWFFLGQKEKDGALADFQKVTELEPNYAKAWVNLGNLLQEKRELKEARADHLKALEVYNRWKDADRIDPIEKEMVSLPPPVLTFLQKEVGP